MEWKYEADPIYCNKRVCHVSWLTGWLVSQDCSYPSLARFQNLERWEASSLCFLSFWMDFGDDSQPLDRWTSGGGETIRMLALCFLGRYFVSVTRINAPTKQLLFFFSTWGWIFCTGWVYAFQSHPQVVQLREKIGLLRGEVGMYARTRFGGPVSPFSRRFLVLRGGHRGGLAGGCSPIPFSLLYSPAK